MTKNPIRACLVAGVSIALLAGANALAQDTAPPASKPNESPATQPPGRGAPPADGRQARQRGGAPGQGPQNLEGAMKGMGRALKALQETIGDASKQQDNLKAINDMERNCVIAKGMSLPSDVRKEVTDPAERAKLALTFRGDMLKLLKDLVELEQSVVDGKTAQAKTQLDAIVKVRENGHKALDIKDE